MANQSRIGTFLGWNVARTVLAAVVIALMTAYVSGWLLVTAWVTFAWLALYAVLELIAVFKLSNRAFAAARRTR